MKLVFIAHRLGSVNREEKRLEAERWLEWAARQGVVPIAPWITLAKFWDESRRAECMKLNNEALRRCEEYWMCGKEIGPGMLEQQKLAELHGLSIRRFEARESHEP